MVAARSSARPDPPALRRLMALGAGLSIMIFPVMLLAGFATHPDIIRLKMPNDVNGWIAEWRNSVWFHIGHLMVMFAVPFIFVACVRIMAMLDGPRGWYGLIGGSLGIFGAFMLAVDKGALTFVLTAFWQMPEPDFTAITPALQAIFNRDGWLWLTWGFVALPVGFIVLALGLLRQSAVPRWQGASMIAGLVLLMNPDIEIISTAGAILMCAGFIPLGMRVAAGQI